MIPPPLPSFMSGPRARKQGGRFRSLASQSSTICGEQHYSVAAGKSLPLSSGHVPTTG